MNTEIEKNKEIATRFIRAFNTDDWDTVREVVAPNYTFHHPIGGMVQAVRWSPPLNLLILWM